MKALATALFALGVALATSASAQEAPDALVKRVAQETVDLIRGDPRLQAGDAARVREVIESRLLPHFDFARMTQLAMGRNWRLASPEQQKRLTDEFRTLLVRTYSSALTQYRDETIVVKALRAESGATDVTVRTEVVRQGRAPVAIDYGMARTPEGWRAYDVVVGGVSLVTNYRDEFNALVKSSGVDGLVGALVDKNRTGAK